ncbi:hypothetical protein ACFVY1_40690, partial [Streptomyces sp. NPDC058293]|uniref:hypothetical protein n=1 Tax=Streptomyces sp. NPDC058293 TaxID=3346429 RepID=UPI0036E369FB
MNQREHDVLEDRPVGDPAAMTAQGVVRDERLTGGQERGKLVPQGFEHKARELWLRRDCQPVRGRLGHESGAPARTVNR